MNPSCALVDQHMAAGNAVTSADRASRELAPNGAAPGLRLSGDLMNRK
jgi:hypothetical protein